MTQTQLPENAQKWVSELRSGKYKQGTGELHSHTSERDLFCCLGVACDLAVKSGVEVKIEAEGYSIYYDGDGGLLPPSVREWLGINSSDGRIAYDENLTSHNDYGVPFAKIADIIEENADTLFGSKEETND